MAQSLEELTTKFHKLSTRFEGFQEMMQESLDMWSGMEAWRLTADESFEVLLKKTTSVTERIDSATTRITRLEQHLSPPLLPLPHPHAPHPTGFDLNSAPHPSPRLSTVDGNLPSGHHQPQDHRVLGGGILGPPPRLVNLLGEKKDNRAIKMEKLDI